MTEDYIAVCANFNPFYNPIYIHSAWLCIYQNLRQLHIYLQFHVTKPVRVADAGRLKYTHWTSILAT